MVFAAGAVQSARGRLCRLCIYMLLGCVSPTGVWAQDDKKTDDDKPADPDTGQSTIEETTLGVLPNPFVDRGVKFAATYIGEALGNISGGVRQGAIYEGRLNLAVDVDLEKLIGLSKLTFHANLFQIHGDGLSRSYLQNFMVVSGIEALPTTRLYEMWFEQKWVDNIGSLKVGQLAADSEFFNAKYTDVFTNASLGWPAITSINLPSGGPSPPLAALGARLQVNLSDSWTVQGAIFNGDSSGPGLDDPQLRNQYGINFRINDPPLLLGQLQYAWNNHKGDEHLAGTIKLGGWRHFGAFADERFAADGRSLADPITSGIPAYRSGNYGLWAVLEQQLYRVPGNDDRGVGVFARASFSPPDRNLADVYADGGLEWIGPSDARPNDKFGVSIGYTHVSRQARALDADYGLYANPSWPARTSEVMITTAYQYEIRAGWSLQPNVQYIVRPGGGATSPSSSTPGLVLKDAAVLGLRTVVKF
jgi:porin